MGEPSVGIRGEIGVIGKDIFWTNILLELDEEATATYAHMQGVEGLHLVDLARAEIALAQRRHSQVDNRLLERLLAKAAAGNFLNRLCERSHNILRVDGVHSVRIFVLAIHCYVHFSS